MDCRRTRLGRGWSDSAPQIFSGAQTHIGEEGPRADGGEERQLRLYDGRTNQCGAHPPSPGYSETNRASLQEILNQRFFFGQKVFDLDLRGFGFRVIAAAVRGEDSGVDRERGRRQRVRSDLNVTVSIERFRGAVLPEAR